MKELQRVLANNGQLLFIVPVGKPKIRFNAHGIYSYDQIISYLRDLKLEEFMLICDDMKIVYNADKELVSQQNYGCGVFCLERIIIYESWDKK